MPVDSVKTKIFVVSLSDAADRRAAFSRRAENAAVSWRFFDAHRALDSYLTYDPSDATRHHGRVLQAGELGCYSSHVSLWRQLVEDGADQYFIFEDDVIIDWKMIQILSEHDFSANGQNYVRLYYKNPCQSMVLAQKYPTRATSLLQLFGRAYGTQGYIITREGASRLMAACRKVRRPIDDQMDRFWEHGVPNLALFPFPLLDEAVDSEIGAQRFAEVNKTPPLKRRLLIWGDTLKRRKAVFQIRAARKVKKYMKPFAMGQ